MVILHLYGVGMSDQTEVIETLSKRELEVAAAYADGASYKEIARDLGISPTTVRSHLRTVYSKLNVTSKIALAQMLADPGEAPTVLLDNEGLTADLALELDDAMRRERMMADVLRLINRRDTSLDEVIDALLDHALEICESQFGTLFEYHGDLTISEMRSRGIPDAFAEWIKKHGKIKLSPYTAVGRMTETLEIVHIADVRGEGPEYQDNPMRVATVELGKARSFAAIPIISGGNLIGAFTVYRTRVHPFNDRALELAQAFADQAAIAIENTRHYAAVESRLDQAAATREILEAISGSRDDEGPVFDTILRNAAKLCNSPMARLELADSARETFHCAAAWGEEMRSFQIGETMPLNHPNDLPTSIREGVVRHIHDLSQTELYLEGDPTRVRMVEEEGYRTYLVVPLIANGVSIGGIVLSRREVAPFSDENIALVENLAKQAVIAIENVRQFRELKERLDSANATREILALMSRVREDEQPIFEAIVDNATRLCGAPNASLILGREGDASQVMAAHRNSSEETLELYNSGGVPMDPDDSLVAKAIIEQRVIHLPDMKESEGYLAGHERFRMLVDGRGIRTNLFVPLISPEGGVGCFILYKTVAEPFTADQIALVETFAAQAAIALENVRQFRAIQTANDELETQLEREAATSEILSVISQSRDDETPVFDVILRQAARLCRAPQAGLIMPNEAGTHVKYIASWGPPSKHFEVGVSEWPIDDPIAITTSIRESRIVNIADTANDSVTKDQHPSRLEIIEKEGIRSVLAVPLIRNGVAIGCFDVYRTEVDPFTDDEVSLLQNFAAQAVIAIENVNQFRALQTRLDREAATSQILGAISASRDDDIPVFNTILENACRVCDAQSAFITVLDESGEYLTGPAQFGVGAEFAETFDGWTAHLATSPLGAAQCIRERKAIAFDDIADSDLYREGNFERVRQVDIEGMRSIVCVPLLTVDAGLGSMILYRKQVQPFTGEDIAMVEAFAAQAVIAIENAQQFRALQARTAEVQSLNASLEVKVADQVGEIERMGRLKRFLPAAVADTVISTGSEGMLESHRALLGVLFCDIRGFTAFCETAEPEETIEVLQTYHEEMGKLINAHGAGVDLRMGDGVMVLFNDPIPCDDPAGDAVRLGIAMRARMAELCKRWRRLGHRLGFGVGVSLGYATVGMVGFEGRFDYTASGTAINLASRLCDEAEDGEILLSTRAGIAVEQDFAVETRGELSLKGIREPVEVFRLVSESGA